jgi:hypothetical protein
MREPMACPPFTEKILSFDGGHGAKGAPLPTLL